jgi:hypothetical protein
VLVILIDQLEELFAWPKADAEHFLRLLQALCAAHDAPVWLVATMRSDFQHRLCEFPTLGELAGLTEIKGPDEAEGTLELALPSAADLREMIVNPAQAAGLSYETSQDGRRDLAELIEAQARPEAMPAIQYLLTSRSTEPIAAGARARTPRARQHEESHPQRISASTLIASPPPSARPRMPGSPCRHS